MKIIQLKIKLYSFSDIKNKIYNFITQKFINRKKEYITEFLSLHDNNIKNFIIDSIYYHIKDDNIKWQLKDKISDFIQQQEKETLDLLLK